MVTTQLRDDINACDRPERLVYVIADSVTIGPERQEYFEPSGEPILDTIVEKARAIVTVQDRTICRLFQALADIQDLRGDRATIQTARAIAYTALREHNRDA